MSARAQWHLAELSTEDGDPFSAVVYSAGLEIDLTGTAEELDLALVETIEREGRMFDQGLTCEMKDAGQDCRTCPMAQLDYREPRARLCRLGKDQAAVIEAGRTAERDGDELKPAAAEDAVFKALAPDLMELLAGVGL